MGATASEDLTDLGYEDEQLQWLAANAFAEEIGSTRRYHNCGRKGVKVSTRKASGFMVNSACNRARAVIERVSSLHEANATSSMQSGATFGIISRSNPISVFSSEKSERCGWAHPSGAKLA